MENNLQIDILCITNIVFLTSTLLIEPEGSLQILKDQNVIEGS